MTHQYPNDQSVDLFSGQQWVLELSSALTIELSSIEREITLWAFMPQRSFLKVGDWGIAYQLLNQNYYVFTRLTLL